MSRPIRGVAFAAAVSVISHPLAALSASAATKPLNACTVFTEGEVRRIGGTAAAGVVDLSIPPEMHDIGGGGTDCGVGLVEMQLDPVPVSGFGSFKKAAAKEGKQTKLSGIGDEAYLYETRDGVASQVAVLMRVGKHVLTMQLAPIEEREIAAARKSLTALAKAAVAKLKK